MLNSYVKRVVVAVVVVSMALVDACCCCCSIIQLAELVGKIHTYIQYKSITNRILLRCRPKAMLGKGFGGGGRGLVFARI